MWLVSGLPEFTHTHEFCKIRNLIYEILFLRCFYIVFKLLGTSNAEHCSRFRQKKSQLPIILCIVNMEHSHLYLMTKMYPQYECIFIVSNNKIPF